MLIIYMCVCVCVVELWMCVEGKIVWKYMCNNKGMVRFFGIMRTCS